MIINRLIFTFLQLPFLKCCPTPYQLFEGHCFHYLPPIRRDFEQAIRACVAVNGGELVSKNFRSSKRFILTKLQSSNDTKRLQWIGITDLLKEQKKSPYGWMYLDGSEVPSTEWDKLPNNANNRQDCVAWDNQINSLNDLYCQNKLITPLVCEFDISLQSRLSIWSGVFEVNRNSSLTKNDDNQFGVLSAFYSVVELHQCTKV